MTNYKLIKTRITTILEEAKKGLSDADYKEALSLIEHNEFGVALELVCDQLFEHNAKISQSLYQDIILIATEMELDGKRWRTLQGLIRA
ncbi:MafI family immunity protein [bacterium]|nr:MafI family immunity protein [Candidatus Paceibacterota bacterium]MCK6544195.1 MafI family immunity protein [bacterium]